MKRLLKLFLNVLVVAALIGMQGCQKEEMQIVSGDQGLELKNASSNTFYSKTVPVGNGIARAWIKADKAGNPLEVGINLSANALNGLPDHMSHYVLELPKNKGMNFYKHVLIDWNPAGHEPPEIYDLPHFDFHFYTISSDERMTIPGMDPPYMDPAPADQYLPPMHMQLEGLVPAMGAHWVNMLSPELPPTMETFTQTFIWGSYQGEFVFWEPMVTRDYLLTKPDQVFPVPQPAAYQRDGWYPLNYKISYSGKPNEFTIALTDLTWHEGQ